MTTSIEQNKSIVRRFFRAIETGDLSVFDEIVAEKYQDHLAGRTPGRESLKHYFAALHAALPDIRFAVHHMVAEGDMVAVMNSIAGTHRGDLMGMKASGHSVDVQAFQLYRIEDGMLAEHWEVADFATLAKQIAG